VPDTRIHRGPNPLDASLFSAAALPSLAAAASDLCWLLSRDYAPASAATLVGNRYQLAARQRAAVARCACSDADLTARNARRATPPITGGNTVRIDGYNVLTSVEAALSGGVILAARDGTFRDMAGMHGSYRKVSETRPAIQRIGQTLADARAAAAEWFLDRPVSNSGRLKTILLETAAACGWTWSVQLVANPDAVLSDGAGLIATADSAVLDRCGFWLNLARETIARHVPDAWIVDLSGVFDSALLATGLTSPRTDA
jgi:hypothetical protein